MAAPFQPGPFQPFSIYDAPGAIFHQAWSNTLTAKGLAGAVFNPAKLTPAERETFADEVGRAGGGNAMVKAFADIALNPWAWFAFAVAPTANSVFKEGAEALSAGNVFKLHKEWSGTVTDRPHIFKGLGLLSAMGAVDNVTQAMATTTASAARGAEVEIRTAFEPVVHEFFRKNGVASWDAEALTRSDPIKAEMLKGTKALLGASLDGWDKDRQVLRGYDSEKGAFKFETRAAMTDGAQLEAAIGRVPGLSDVRDAMRDAMAERKIKLWGREGLGAGVFEYDQGKGDRIYRGLGGGKDANQLYAGDGDNMDQRVGGAWLRRIFGDEFLGDFKKGRFSKEEFNKLVEKAASAELPDQYLPRNIWEPVGGPSGGLRPNRYARGLAPDPSAVARLRLEPLWHPEDMRAFERTGVGVTSAFIEQAAQSEKVLAESMEDGGKGVRMLRMDPLQSVRRYSYDSSATWANHVAEVDPFVLDEQERVVRGGEWDKPTGLVGSTWGEGKARLNKVWKELGEGEGPAGGISNADVLKAAYAHEQDTYGRATIEKFIVPHLTGVMDERESFLTTTALHAKKLMGAFAETGMAKAIGNSGEWGRQWLDGLKTMSEAEMPAGFGAKAGRGVASWMYLTHLGFNMASVITNLMQPATLAATWLGTPAVIHGYAEAAKEMFNYLGARVGKYGVGPISVSDRAELAHNAFRFADLSGIGKDTLEAIEGKLSPTGGLGEEEGFISKMAHYGMSMFSKSDWFVQSAAAHATEYKFREAGLPTVLEDGESLDPKFRYTALRMSNTSQFTGSPLEQPLAFATADTSLHPWGRMFRSPLTRQFLSYPVRALTGTFYAGPRLGGEEPTAARAGLQVLRGMGISSVIYELGKHLFHADLSRGLFYATATDAIPGLSQGRLDTSGGPVPLPPVFDIPWQFVRSFDDPSVTILGNVAPRLIPGGLALSKALGVAPKLPQAAVLGGLPGAMQRTYADWNGARGPGGTVALYKGDGSLLGYQDPTALVLKGLGADLGAFQQQGELAQFLVKNREQIVDYRRRALGAMAVGDVGQVKRIQDEFQRRFKLPLTVTQQQVQATINQRAMARPDRIVATLPQAARAPYAAMLAQTPDVVRGGPATARGAQGPPARMQPPSPPRAQAFGGFGGF